MWFFDCSSYYHYPPNPNSTPPTHTHTHPSPGLNPEDVADQFYKHFGPGTEYAIARQQAENNSSSAVQGPWTNHNLSIFLGLREAGVKPSADEYSMDPDGIVRSIPVVALLSGKPEMLGTVEKCVKVTQVCMSVC